MPYSKARTRFNIAQRLVTGRAPTIALSCLRIFILWPFVEFYNTAVDHWTLIKGQELLRPGGGFDPAIAMGEKSMAHWSTVGMSWNIAAWIPSMYSPPPFNMVFGIPDIAVTVHLSHATHGLGSYIPKSFSDCEGAGPHTLLHPPAMNESFFEAAGRLNGTFTTPYRMCRSFVREWQFAVSMSFFCALISFLNLIGFTVSLISLYLDACDQNVPYWRVLLKVCVTATYIVTGALWHFIFFIPMLIFEKMPHSVKSKIRIARRHRLKVLRAYEERFRTWIESTIKKKNIASGEIQEPKSIFIAKMEGEPEGLAKLLSVWDLLLMIAEDLHYTDIISLSLASKSMREAILPSDALAARKDRLKAYTCRGGKKKECWACANQICEVFPSAPAPSLCTHIRRIPVTNTNFHLQCRPYCTPCYTTRIQLSHTRSLPIYTDLGTVYRSDTRSCCCAPDSQGSRHYQHYWFTAGFPDDTFADKQPKIRTLERKVCGLCMGSGLENPTKRIEERSAVELKRGDAWGRCAGCKGVLDKGIRWWGCAYCKRECTSRLHGAWADACTDGTRTAREIREEEEHADGRWWDHSWTEPS